MPFYYSLSKFNLLLEVLILAVFHRNLSSELRYGVCMNLLTDVMLRELNHLRALTSHFINFNFIAILILRFLKFLSLDVFC